MSGILFFIFASCELLSATTFCIKFMSGQSYSKVHEETLLGLFVLVLCLIPPIRSQNNNAWLTTYIYTRIYHQVSKNWTLETILSWFSWKWWSDHKTGLKYLMLNLQLFLFHCSSLQRKPLSLTYRVYEPNKKQKTKASQEVGSIVDPKPGPSEDALKQTPSEQCVKTNGKPTEADVNRQSQELVTNGASTKAIVGNGPLKDIANGPPKGSVSNESPKEVEANASLKKIVDNVPSKMVLADSPSKNKVTNEQVKKLVNGQSKEMKVKGPSKMIVKGPSKMIATNGTFNIPKVITTNGPSKMVTTTNGSAKMMQSNEPSRMIPTNAPAKQILTNGTPMDVDMKPMVLPTETNTNLSNVHFAKS